MATLSCGCVCVHVPQGSAPGGGLQGLLKAAQQKHSSSQRAPSAAANLSPVPTPNSTSMPAEPAGAGSTGAAALLTPAFFEQQQQKSQGPPAASHAAAQPVAAAAPPEPAAPAPAAAVVNGPTQGSNPLQQLLSRCVCRGELMAREQIL